jgi:hypothetical protein
VAAAILLVSQLLLKIHLQNSSLQQNRSRVFFTSVTMQGRLSERPIELSD